MEAGLRRMLKFKIPLRVYACAPPARLEGNTPENRAKHVAAGGQIMSEGYADLLRELLPGAVVTSASRATPAPTCPTARRSKAMTASPSPARRCMSTTAAPG